MTEGEQDLPGSASSTALLASANSSTDLSAGSSCWSFGDVDIASGRSWAGDTSWEERKWGKSREPALMNPILYRI